MPVADDSQMLELTEVIRLLLQHVGSMCLHQLHSDFMYTPFDNYSVQQYPVNYVDLERICDILSNSVTTGHSKTVICALIVLQVTNRW